MMLVINGTFFKNEGEGITTNLHLLDRSTRIDVGQISEASINRSSINTVGHVSKAVLTWLPGLVAYLPLKNYQQCHCEIFQKQ